MCSRSFSKNQELCSRLYDISNDVKLNQDGLVLEGDLLVDFLRDRTHAIVGLETINESILDKLPGLEVVSKYGVGLDSIDLSALKKFDVRLGWTPGVNSLSVAELALGLTLSSLRRICEANSATRNGQWGQLQGELLSGKAVGIVGFGHVGQDFARLLGPFKCQIYVNDIRPINSKNWPQVIQTSLDDLLRDSSIVSLHVPLTTETFHLIDKRRLDSMKPTALIVNTSRGGVIDEQALLAAMSRGRINSAALDVLEMEPPSVDDQLITRESVLITPHIGGSTREAIIAMGEAAIRGLIENKLPDADRF